MSGAAGFKPYDLLIVQRIPDGEGGFTRNTIGTRTIYLNVEFHATGTKAICKVESEVTVKDIISIDGGEYEVLPPILRQDGSQYKSLTLERKDKPIEPVAGDVS